jgi:hypothetical protein
MESSVPFKKKMIREEIILRGVELASLSPHSRSSMVVFLDDKYSERRVPLIVERSTPPRADPACLSCGPAQERWRQSVTMGRAA